MLDLKTMSQAMKLASLGSFNKAAATLNITQPALTKRIARLEDELGTQLFHRSKQGVTLTETGAFYLKHGKLLIEQAELLRRDIMLMSEHQIGNIALGVGPVIEQMFLPDILADFTQQYPNIEINVQVDNGSNLLARLTKGEIDLAISVFPNSDVPTGIHCEDLICQPVVYVVRPGHPLLSGKPEEVSMAEVMQYPLAAPEIPAPFLRWLENNARTQITPQVKCEQYRVLTSIVKRTDQVTGGPALIFKEDVKDGELVALPLKDVMDWQCTLMMRSESTGASTIKVFSELAVKHLRKYANA